MRLELGWGTDSDMTRNPGQRNQGPSMGCVMLGVLLLPVTAAVSTFTLQHTHGTVTVCEVTWKL